MGSEMCIRDRRRLANVEKRGGDMRLISAARSDNFATVAAARHCYRRLLRNRIRIFEYQPQMLHVKLIVADNTVYIGSANFDMRSLYINGEVMVRICLLYTSDAADERSSVDLGGRRIIKKKTKNRMIRRLLTHRHTKKTVGTEDQK